MLFLWLKSSFYLFIFLQVFLAMPALHTRPICLSHYGIRTSPPHAPAPLLRTSSLLTSVGVYSCQFLGGQCILVGLEEMRTCLPTGVSLVEIRASRLFSSFSALYICFLLLFHCLVSFFRLLFHLFFCLLFLFFCLQLLSFFRLLFSSFFHLLFSLFIRLLILMFLRLLSRSSASCSFSLNSSMSSTTTIRRLTDSSSSSQSSTSSISFIISYSGSSP